MRIYKVWTDERCPAGEEVIFSDEEELARNIWEDEEEDVPEEWFVESLNDSFDPVEIAGRTWKPADVLKKMLSLKDWRTEYLTYAHNELNDLRSDAYMMLKHMKSGEKIQENGYTIRCEECSNKTLMETLIEAGFPEKEFDHHESDLYVPREINGRDTTKIIVRWFVERGYASYLFMHEFKDQVTGKPMWEISFQYTPWWQEHCGKEKTHEAQS